MSDLLTTEEAALYHQALADLPLTLPVTRPYSTHSFFLYVVRTQQREQYQAWEQREVDQLRGALPPEELAAREAAVRARLRAEGTPAVALPLAVRVAVDTGLAGQAGLPTFEDWQQTQETGR